MDDEEADGSQRMTHIRAMLQTIRAMQRRRPLGELLSETFSSPLPSPSSAASVFNDFADLLPFRLERNDGGEFSSAYSCHNILRNDSTVYCSTGQKNVNVVVRHDPADPKFKDFSFSLTHVIVKPPLHGFTSPVKEVLFFIFDEFPDIEASKQFDNLSYPQYLEFMAQREKAKKHLPSDPIAFVRLGKGIGCGVEEIKPIRSGKFILIKFLSSDGRGENIDCQFVGFRGFVGQRSFSSVSLC